MRKFWLFFIITSQLEHWKHNEAHLITYNVTIQKLAKLFGVRSLACKIKILILLLYQWVIIRELEKVLLKAVQWWKFSVQAIN